LPRREAINPRSTSPRSRERDRVPLSREGGARMPLKLQRLHPHFVAEVTGADLRHVHDPETLAGIRRSLDEHAVLVFHDQPLADAEHLAFARRLDGQLHTRLGAAVIDRNRFGNEALGDISNVGADGEILPPGDRRRAYSLGNRLWHTDASFQDPPGRYSLLSAQVVPPLGADTEFADTRSAYDALPPEVKARIEGLRAHHSIAYSRQTLGFEFSAEEQEALKGAVHPLVRTIPGSGRRCLYVASHASRIVDWPVPEGRLLLRDLIEHATQPEFVYRHAWRVGDLVIWDNRATMHRGRPFEDTKYRRELRRVTTLDV
jgi:alpha-ketoglutarate-dependent 2,4-dichlorophenoxyacetate dioxygenase